MEGFSVTLSNVSTIYWALRALLYLQFGNRYYNMCTLEEIYPPLPSQPDCNLLARRSIDGPDTVPRACLQLHTGTTENPNSCFLACSLPVLLTPRALDSC